MSTSTKEKEKEQNHAEDREGPTCEPEFVW
jgi:hypothetical protein